MVRIFIRMLRMLPNIIQYYPSSFTTTLHHSLLHFIIHYYTSSFATTIHYSLLPYNIPYYPSLFTTTIHHSLLPFIIHYYPSSFSTSLHHSLLPFIIHYCHSLFPATALSTALIEKLLCFQQVHYSFPLSHPFHSHSAAYHPPYQDSWMCSIQGRKEDIKIDINMY